MLTMVSVWDMCMVAQTSEAECSESRLFKKTWNVHQSRPARPGGAGEEEAALCTERRAGPREEKAALEVSHRVTLHGVTLWGKGRAPGLRSRPILSLFARTEK